MNKFLKIYVTIILILISTSNSFSQQWVQTNGPVGGTNKLSFMNSQLFAGTFEGIYVSTDNGGIWTFKGLANDRISSFAQVGSDLFASTFDNGVYISTNNGGSWNQMNNGITDLEVRCLYVNATDIFAGTFGGGIFRSSNHGANWNAINAGVTIPYIFDIVSNGTELFAATIGGVIKSTNNGDNWISSGLDNKVIFNLLLNGNNIFAANEDGFANNCTLYRSTDNGGNWTATSLILPLESIAGLAVIGNHLYAATTNNHGVYHSTDNGSSWVSINQGFTILPVMYSLSIANNYLFLGTNQNVWRRELDSPLPIELSSFTSNVYDNCVNLKWATSSEVNNSGFEIERSIIKGQTSNDWNKIGFVQGNGNSNTSHSYTYTDRNLQSGKYKYRVKQIDFNGNFEYYNLSNEVIIGIPDKMYLSQNYPNPFNPVTKLGFGMSELGFVSIKVYNSVGKEVMTLVDEKKDAGYYEVTFNGNNLSSGIYFYRLSVDGNTVDTKRMALLK